MISVSGMTNYVCVCYRGKIVLGYTEAELRVRGTGYQFIHAADMLYCAENHVRSETTFTWFFLVLLFWCAAQHSFF